MFKKFHVIFSVEEIKFTKELEDIKVKELGKKVVFECELSREGLKVDWYRGNKSVRKDSKHEMEDTGT